MQNQDNNNVPQIPEIKTEDAVNLLLASIAYEELGLTHILNAEAEKVQSILGTLKDQQAKNPSVSELERLSTTVDKILKDIIKKDLLLGIKLENVLEIPRTIVTPKAPATSTMITSAGLPSIKDAAPPSKALTSASESTPPSSMAQDLNAAAGVTLSTQAHACAQAPASPLDTQDANAEHNVTPEHHTTPKYDTIPEHDTVPEHDTIPKYDTAPDEEKLLSQVQKDKETPPEIFTPAGGGRKCRFSLTGSGMTEVTSEQDPYLGHTVSIEDPMVCTRNGSIDESILKYRVLPSGTYSFTALPATMQILAPDPYIPEPTPENPNVMIIMGRCKIESKSGQDEGQFTYVIRDGGKGDQADELQVIITADNDPTLNHNSGIMPVTGDIQIKESSY